MNVERNEDGDLIFFDVEYENEIMMVADNKDPYGVKPVAISTIGDWGYGTKYSVVGLSLDQIEDLIAELMTISAKYE